MKPTIDIHNYDMRYDRGRNQLLESSISDKNKKLIMQFDRICVLEGLTKARRYKLINTLLNFAKQYFPKDFDKATKKDIQNAILKIEKREDYSPWTKQNYKSIVKKFYKWLKFGDDYNSRKEYPDIVSWISTTIKTKDKPKVKASDILTEKEIEVLVEVAEHTRDKAFISMIYELGARIGEIGNLRIRDITKDEYSYLVDLKGKTGTRTSRVIFSSPYILSWLNAHPLKEDPDSPLWVMVGKRNKANRMAYGALRALVKRLTEKAKIKKRIYPHLFRHTRVTHLLMNKKINEAQAKVYFGWVPSSKMLADYSHLVSMEVNDVMLEIYGIKKPKIEKSKLRPMQCPLCKTINPKSAKFCQKCGNIMDVKTAFKLQEKRKRISRAGGILNYIIKNKKYRKDLEVLFDKVSREMKKP